MKDFNRLWSAFLLGIIFTCGAIVWLINRSSVPDGSASTSAPARQAASGPTSTPWSTSTPEPTATLTPTITPGPSPTPAPTSTPKPRAVQTREAWEAMQGILTDTAKTEFGDKFIAAKLYRLGRDVVATVDYYLGPQWSESTAATSAVMDLKLHAPKIFTGTAINVLELRAFADFKDKYANDVKNVAFKFTITDDLAKKINWDGIANQQLARVVVEEGNGNGVYVHPSLRKAWAGMLAD